MSFVISHPDVEGTAVIAERALAAHAANGWLLVEQTDQAPAESQPVALEMPARNASLPQWRTYAVVARMPYEQAMSKTRDELADHYRPAPTPKTPGKGSNIPQES